MTGPVSMKSEKDKGSGKAEGYRPESARSPMSFDPYANIMGLQHMSGNHAVSRLLQPDINNVLPIVQNVLNYGNSQSLDQIIRKYMESSFNKDLSSVRVYTGPTAEQAAIKLGARAFTTGVNIVLGQGVQVSDKNIMAHELTHVIQQANGKTSRLHGLDGDQNYRNILEKEASNSATENQMGKIPMNFPSGTLDVPRSQSYSPVVQLSPLRPVPEPKPIPPMEEQIKGPSYLPKTVQDFILDKYNKGEFRLDQKLPKVYLPFAGERPWGNIILWVGQDEFDSKLVSLEIYQYYPEDIGFYKDFHKEDDKLARGLQHWAINWNKKMKLYVELQKMRPSDAKQRVREESEIEPLVAVSGKLGWLLEPSVIRSVFKGLAGFFYSLRGSEKSATQIGPTFSNESSKTSVKSTEAEPIEDSVQYLEAKEGAKIISIENTPRNGTFERLTQGEREVTNLTEFKAKQKPRLSPPDSEPNAQVCEQTSEQTLMDEMKLASGAKLSTAKSTSSLPTTVASAKTGKKASIPVLVPSKTSSKGAKPLKRHQSTDYSRYNLKSRVGDPFEGHEVMMNAWLEKLGIIKKRGVGHISRANAAIALTAKQHDLVSTMQQRAGLFDEAVLAKMGLYEILEKNAQILLKAGVPMNKVIEVIDYALEMYPAIAGKAPL